MSKLVKIVLMAPGAAEAAFEMGPDKKQFLETLIEERDENINTGPGLVGLFNCVGTFPRYPGIPSHPGIALPLSPPSSTKVAPEEAVKRAVERKLREYNLNIDKSRLNIQTLTESTPAEDRPRYEGKFLYIALYKLSDNEKMLLERRHLYSPFLPTINFFPLTGLPIGLPFVDAGVARFLTTRFDIIRDSIYLGDPRIIFPTTILPYNSIYPFPFYSPFTLSPISRYNSTYVDPRQIFEPTNERRSRSPSRSPSRGRSQTKGKRDKYLKYKQKYLELKSKIDKL